LLQGIYFGAKIISAMIRHIFSRVERSFTYGDHASVPPIFANLYQTDQSYLLIGKTYCRISGSTRPKKKYFRKIVHTCSYSMCVCRLYRRSVCFSSVRATAGENYDSAHTTHKRKSLRGRSRAIMYF